MHPAHDRIPDGNPDGCPAICPYGHQLGSGRVLVGWLPCRCKLSLEERGHRTYFCRSCYELPDKRQVICYFGPHWRESSPKPQAHYPIRAQA